MESKDDTKFIPRSEQQLNPRPPKPVFTSGEVVDGEGEQNHERDSAGNHDNGDGSDHYHHSGSRDDLIDDDVSVSERMMDILNDVGSPLDGSRPEEWTPTGVWWRDFLHFAGPGWLISIAYVDPGNYQADIQAGATTRYYLLFCVWWTSILSIYIQILCVRLAYYGQCTLAEAQAKNAPSNGMRYLNWAIAEFSTIITDLPEVIGIGIALKIFFGWPYYVGVLLSMLTTMMFLATMNFGVRILETIVAVFVAIMSIALFVEMSWVGEHTTELLEGWVLGFKDVTSSDIFSITGILGAVVMPHNLYLHTGACQNRKVKRNRDAVVQAVRWSSIEPVLPIVFSFFVNMAVVAIAAERVFGTDNAANVGLTDFCNYFQTLQGGCVLFGIALLAAGQSSAITTTFTGQYVMDGFLKMRLPTSLRATISRLVAITPCVLVSVLLPNRLNAMVNLVNSSLAFLLPFAFTPLVKYTCSQEIMGQFVAGQLEKRVLYTFCFLVWAVNAIGLSIRGGGLFGDWRPNIQGGFAKTLIVFVEVMLQLFYAWWNWNCVRSEVKPIIDTTQQQDLSNGDGDIPPII